MSPSEAWILQARRQADLVLSSLPARLAHTKGVAERAGQLERLGPKAYSRLVAAAWLHDVGYATEVVITGFHPLDGAHWLRDRGWNEDVVAIVAHHSCAEEEAKVRGLASQLARIPPPDPQLLALLTWADMTTGPTGDLVAVEERIKEILERYPHDDPVSLAVRRSAPKLIATVVRVEKWLQESGQPI